MAGLLAAAAEPAPDFPLVSLSSEGVVLIYGRDESAIEAGKLLADHLDVTVMITRPQQIVPPSARPSRSSREPSATPRAISGPSNSSSTITRPPAPPRVMRSFLSLRAMARLRAAISCLIFPAVPRFFRRMTLRDGYLRADPRDPAACCARCSRRAISSAVSISRNTSTSPQTSARIRARD